MDRYDLYILFLVVILIFFKVKFLLLKLLLNGVFDVNRGIIDILLKFRLLFKV